MRAVIVTHRPCRRLDYVLRVVLMTANYYVTAIREKSNVRLTRFNYVRATQLHRRA